MSMIGDFPDPVELANVDVFLARHANPDRMRRNDVCVPVARGGNPAWPLGRLNAFGARYFDALYQARDAIPGRAFLDVQAAELFSRHDRCEVFFCFGGEASLEGGLILADPHAGRHGAAGLSVTRNLQAALCNLGFLISEFRTASRNASPAVEYLRRSARRRRPPILSWEQLEALIARTSSTAFLFCLYAIVPITDLIGLDLGRPVTMTNSRIASIDPQSGAFQHVDANGPVTVCGGDGRFVTGWHLQCSPMQTGLITGGARNASLYNVDTGA